MPDEKFDYIVIGSGSAGGVVAARLTEDPDVTVLLLEAGPADDDDMIHIPLAFSTLFKTKWDWGYQTTPQKHLGGRRADWPRMKALGGCSSMNAMIYIRGNHADYDEWRDAYGATGWGYDDVLPYFKKAEGNTRLGGPFHGTDGPLHVEDRSYNHELSTAFVEAAVAAGLKRNDDFNGAEQEGVGPLPGHVQEGPPLVGRRRLHPPRRQAAQPHGPHRGVRDADRDRGHTAPSASPTPAAASTTWRAPTPRSSCAAAPSTARSC